MRAFSKAVHSRDTAANAPLKEDGPTIVGHGIAMQTPSDPVKGAEPPMRAIYLNLDFPVPVREWEGVFDVWIKGDAQVFARMVQEELENEERMKTAARERKRKRECATDEDPRLAEG